MSPNRHSISAVSTVKKLNTPLKASVVLLTAIILSSCATDGGDDTVTPKPSPILPTSDAGGSSGSGSDAGEASSNGSGAGGMGTVTEAQKAIKAAEAKTKAAEDALKVAEAKTKAAEDELKTAEDTFGKESAQAVVASKKVIAETKIEAVKAKELAQAARVESVAKIEVAAKEADNKIKAAKEAAAKDAVAKVKAVEEKVKAAETRANVAEAKAKEVAESLKVETAAKKAAEAKTTAAEAETKTAQANAKTAEEKAAAAVKAVTIAKAEAEKKIAALKDASASQVAVAEKEAKEAKDALKTAEAQAITAAKIAAKAATDAATAAAKEASAKLDAVKTASESQIAAAKKEAASAQARADKAVKEAAAAQKRVEAAEATAKSESDRADLEASQKEQAIKQAKEAKAEALKAKDEAVKAEEKARKANEEAKGSKQLADKAKGELATAQEELAAAEKALEDAIASGGGNTDLLQAEVDRRQAALDAANAKATAAQQAQTQAAAAAAAQVAAANQAAKDAKDALAASQIKNAPEAKKSGVQTLNVNVVPLSKVYNATTRDFTADKNSVIARADIASQNPDGTPGLLGALTITTSGDGDATVAGSNGFKAHKDNAIVAALGQELPLAYTSTYKDFGDDMRIGHIDGIATFSGLELPVNGAAVVGNATQAANMPTEGKVGYTGDATYRKLGIGNAIEFGKSVFTADFVAKNVKGDLTFANAGKIGLTASINGNQFSGMAADNAGYSTEGGFFGGDAQYLGGVYAGNDAQGTYGAKSDKQTAAEKAAVKAQADADKANAAIAAVQTAADKAQAAATKAQADATKAQEALAAAEDALANAGNGEDQLALALERAEAAEVAEAAAKTAAQTAKAAEQAAKNALVAAQAAADKAVGAAKAEAQKQVDAAKAVEAAAKQEAADAQAAATKAKKEADKAKADAQIAVKEANDRVAKAEAEALQAQNDAAQAKEDAEIAQQQANEARTAAEEAEQKLKAAQDKIKQLEDELENSGSGGSVDIDELKAKLEAAQEVESQLQDELNAAKQAAAAAKTAAAVQVAAANQAQQAAEAALAASQIKNAPETNKSGAQSINVGTSVAGLPDFIVTTRDFEIGDDNVIARADIASNNLLPKVDVNLSGKGDTELENGFMSHNDSTSIPTALGELPLKYTSVYKDYGKDMRIGHIDGAANLNGTDIPVDGVAALGNATKAENMPTEGTVGYTGDATHRKLGIGNAIEFGSSVFTADFVKKALDGKLSFVKAGDINFKANITGNKFSGAADANAGYTTEGGFFGGDAQYLGGVYEGNGAQGTYGAKSDKQTAAEKAAADAKAAAAVAKAASDKANATAQAAQKAAQAAHAQLADKQAEIERLQRRIDNAGSGNGDALQQLQDELDAAIEAANQAKQQKDDALDQLSAAQTTITELQVKVDGLKGDNTQLQAELAQAKKELQAQIDSLKSDNKDLQAQANALQAELDKLKPDAPENIEYAADTKITGVQSNKISGYKGKDGSVKADSQGSYETLTIKAQDLETDYVRGSFDIVLKGDDDTAYKDAESKEVEGFKVHKGTGNSIVPGTSTGGVGSYKRDITYTSVYNKFADMQIGHVYGDIPSLAPTKDGKLSTVYVNGNATATKDMEYMQKLAAHNLQQGLQNGEGVDSGKVKYAGVSTYQKNGDYNGLVTGTSEFKVDFVNHQLDGNLAFRGTDIANKKIKAEINGNKFSGNWNGIDTQGGFFGQDAALLGGLYQDSTGKGTYGAEKGKELPGSTEADMTGFQSTALSSKEKTLPFGLGQLDNAIGYVEIRDDASAWTELKIENGSQVPVDNGKGDNFTSFSKGKVLADMVKPDSVLKPIEVSLTNNGSVTVDAGKGGQNPTFKYSSVYKNFDSQMQVGHVYGNFDSLAGEVSRAANVYVEGYLTSQYGMDNLKTINDGKAQYKGVATYIENIHLADNASTAPVNGTSALNANFVSGKVDGTLSFAAGGYKYMPAGNEIKINADITGNTFAGNVGGIDTAGGFYGEDAKFLGGIYQDASVQGGKGTIAGTGTKFQGTFGAEKQ